MLQDIQKGIQSWAEEERAYWYAAGKRARGTNLDYSGSTWIGYYAFHQGKEGKKEN